MEEVATIKELAKLGGGYVIAILALFWSNKRESRLQDIILKQSEAHAQLTAKIEVQHVINQQD